MIRFQGPLVHGFRDWVGVEVPAEVSERLGTRAQVAVEGTINDFRYRGSLAATGHGHFMWLNKTFRAATGLELGQTIRVAVRPVRQLPAAETPPELTAALAEVEPRLWWEALTPSQRRIASIWIGQAKGAEVRAYRISDVLRRARRAYRKEGPFYPTRQDQPLLNRPKEGQRGRKPS